MLSTGASTNWAGNVTFVATRVHRPTSIDEVRRIVGSAGRVRALGTGHSFSRIADTPHELVRLDGLPATVDIDTTRRTATVAAGMRYAAIAGPLQAAGFALANLASLPHISVAGACATATHGSGVTQPSLSAAVAALRMVGPGGEVFTLSRDTDPERLRGGVVALGALGVVTHVTLDLEPTYDVAQWVYTDLPLERLADSAEEILAAAYSVSVFTDWHSGRGVVWRKHRIGQDAAEPPGRHWLGARLADRPHHPVAGLPPSYCTEQLGVPGPWYERLPHFRPEFTPSHGTELQSELLLPRAVAPEAFAVVRRLSDRLAPALQISEIRTVAADELWLSPSYRQDSVALHFTWVQDTALVVPLIAALEAELLPLGARPHWGKLTTLTPRALAARYERAADFGRLLAEHDPAGTFRTPFVDGLLPPD